jgi:hypothetical protein
MHVVQINWSSKFYSLLSMYFDIWLIGLSHIKFLHDIPLN